MHFIWKQSIFFLGRNFQAYHLEFCEKPECDIKPSCFPQDTWLVGKTHLETLKLGFSGE